jgi:hypothetical protein
LRQPCRIDGKPMLGFRKLAPEQARAQAQRMLEQDAA